jgi:hypothetical protein
MSFLPAEMDDVCFPQLELVGCTASNMLSLAALLEDGENEWDLSYFGSIRTEIEKQVHGRGNERFPSIPQRIVRDVHLIEVPVDYSESKRVLFEELRQKACIL